MIIISLGTFRVWPRQHTSRPVTIIVCARDEEDHILDCLMSLATQDYPESLCKLVLVNHLSNDQTGEIMEAFAESSPVQTRVIHIKEPDPNIGGKIHALTIAMKHVDTEYVLMTDADCIVPESWIRTIVSHFAQDVVAVGSMVSCGPDENSEGGWIGRLQNVDHRYYMGLVGGLSGLAGYMFDRKRKRQSDTEQQPNIRFRPAFVSGNNLGFRLSAYKKCGGYEALGSTLIEDYDLLARMSRATGGYLAFPMEPNAKILTHPLPTLKALWRQKRRWAMSTSTPDTLSYIIYLMLISSRIVLPWMLIWQPLGTVGGLILTALGSTIVIRRVNSLMGWRVRMRDIIIHEFFQILLIHTQLLAIIFRIPVVWKGVKYSKP
ncbi:MAG: glycosyltransferase [Candidatus Electryonea clarkiae]|nr:glycosyltransferase [Candidatus Electryonea clarkiae]